MIAAHKTLLLEIDVQNDFCPAYTVPSGEKYPAGCPGCVVTRFLDTCTTYPAGALAVDRGDEVIAPLNRLAAALAGAGGRAAATQDWHPPGHGSFASAYEGKKPGDLIDLPGAKGQVLWPDHCVQGSRGAAFHERLDLKPLTLIIRKGFRRGLDSYSAFFENDRETPTGLEGWLRGLGIDTVVMGGLATDYCVLYSALDARRLGFTVIVLEDAVRGVGFPQGSVEKALAEMNTQGISLRLSEDILGEVSG